MNIHQLSVTYLPEQDRILARVNTTAREEIRLWLTRRLMLGLWPVLGRMLTEHLLRTEPAVTSLQGAGEELKAMLADFRKEEFLRSADFQTPYKDAAPALPLGEEPLLVTDVDASPLPDGRLRLSFNENPQGTPDAGGRQRRFQMEMERGLMQGLLHLLEQALAQSRWHEAFELRAPPQEDAGPSEIAGRSPGQRYLN